MPRFARATFALTAVGLAAFPLLGCGAAGGSLPDYRYRLTVEVETPEGLRTGSSVIEVSTGLAGANSIPTPGAVSHRVKGEAVAVDLGRRGTLFALLRSDNDVDWASNVMFRLAPRVTVSRDGDGKHDEDRRFRARFDAMLDERGPIELPRTFPDQGHLRNQSARPMMVRFRNIADPTTVEKVDPDELPTAFGPGVKLHRLTIQLTDEPVTSVIDKHLPWIEKYRNKHFDNTSVAMEDMTNANPSSHFSSGVFSTKYAK